MLIDELLKAIQADRERQIAQAQRERLAKPAAATEPEPWTWLRGVKAGTLGREPLRRTQTGCTTPDPSA